MRTEEFDEPITVGDVFRGNQVTPKWFIWGQDKHEVKSVNMVWKGKEGEAPLRYFSVSARGNLYQLCLNQKTMEWRLEKVSVE